LAVVRDLQVFSQNEQQKFDEHGQASCRRFGLLIAPELKQLAAAGMTIGAHKSGGVCDRRGWRMV